MTKASVAVRIGRTSLALLTGIGLRDFLKRHKKATVLIIVLVVLNEIRGIAFVSALLRAWF